MKHIEAVKQGNVVNLSIDGKLQKKNCGNLEEANTLFKAVLTYKNTCDEKDYLVIRSLLNEKIRIAFLAGLETDPLNGEVYLAGFNTPVPESLVKIAKEYHDNGFPIDAIVNFWKLLMINPDKRVRENLFDFITIHDFVLTPTGYMLVYKAVERVDGKANPLAEFVSNRYFQVKKSWKESPKNYVVYQNLVDKSYAITSTDTIAKWDEKEKAIEVLGNLNEMYNSLFTEEGVVKAPAVFQSLYSGAPKMIINLGVPVKQARKECDANPKQDCSNGLHVGATAYVERMYSNADAILVCLVNPANVVAVPDYDHSKMRVCEYFPFAIATYKDGKIDIVEKAYYEDDYKTYEIEELEEQIAKVKAEELPIETAMHADKEARPMSELMKMLESRLVDIE
jgi:hypothetical protein